MKTIYVPDRGMLIETAIQELKKLPETATFNADQKRCRCGYYCDTRNIYSHERNDSRSKLLLSVVQCRHCWMEYQEVKI